MGHICPAFASDPSHTNTPSSIRATVQSLANMGNRLFFVFFSVAMGYLVDASSVQIGYLVLGSLFLITTALPAINLMRAKSRG
ncbi:MAG TPA: hypothetical protein DCY07_05325 [Rhodospirillaceae bacterium]|nr:hypothetical protein [Rhodospirillaceae bacterium]